MQYFFSILLVILTVVFLLGIARAMRMSKLSVALIDKYAEDKKNPKLVEEIFETIRKDFLLNKILKKYGGTKDDISKLHAKLMKWGDFRKYNRYIPITSFFNASALTYLLKHKNDDAQSLTKKMMNHFHI